MGELEWTNSLAIRLIQEYERRPQLWNPAHEMYRVQSMKYELWRDLANKFECDIADLRKKLNSLFASHRREKAKIRAGGRSSWFLYDHMAFLPTHLDPDSGQTQSSKHRAPVKEAAPPVLSEDEEEAEAEAEAADVMFEEHLEEYGAGAAGDAGGDEEPLADYIVVKEESPAPAPAPPSPAPAPAAFAPRARPLRRTPVSSSTHKPRLTRPIKRRRVVSKASPVSEAAQAAHAASSLDIRLAEALKLLRRADLTRRKDECDSFGEYIADSLRKHDDRTQAMIKQAINNIIFEQEMKKYGNQHYVVISGIDENPLILGEEADK